MSVICSKQLKVPAFVKIASDYAIGESVFLIENGSPVEYLVVHQGLPSSRYDSSCNGTWLLRKDIHSEYMWDTLRNEYKQSSIHGYLNNTVLNMFNATTLNAIKTVKIPYVDGTGDNGYIETGANGLSTQVFALAGFEVGFTGNTSQYFPNDSDCLDYFKNATNSKRIALYNRTATIWWLRSVDSRGDGSSWAVYTDGSETGASILEKFGIRPAVIIKSDTMFTPSTNIIK